MMVGDGIGRIKLLKELRKLKECEDIECAHMDADELLLKFINDPKISEVYRSIDKWYS